MSDVVRLSPAEELRELVAVMREMGVTHYQHGDVIVDLGAPLKAETPRITEESKAEARRKTANYRDALQFAASEGFPVDENGMPL